MPLLIWPAAALLGALGIGSYAAGKEAGKAVKLAIFGAGAFAAYRMAKSSGVIK